MGDVFNTLVLVGSLVYLLVAVCFMLPGAEGVVDEHWKKDGFCIQNNDVPYWSSFDTCLYVDIVFSVIIGIMYLPWKDVLGLCGLGNVQLQSPFTDCISSRARYCTRGMACSSNFGTDPISSTSTSTRMKNIRTCPSGKNLSCVPYFGFPFSKHPCQK